MSFPVRSSWLLAVVLLAPACAWTRRFDPPALLEAQTLAPDEALARYPAGSELVELESASGACLRGVYVPSDEGAPVVLHLQDSSGSVARARGAPQGVAAELSDLGLASLIVDYTGVGLSDGERSVRHLLADARAAWQEAVRRAGGDPARVVVRAMSLGTIAAALLLEDGARPGAQVWILPVFPGSVASRFALFAYGAIAQIFASVLFRPVADVDLASCVRRAGVPTTVITARGDELVTRVDLERLAEVVREGGGRFLELEGGHIQNAARARWILPEEFELFRALGRPELDARVARVLAELPPELAPRFAEGTSARGRLVELAAMQRTLPAEDVAAAALGGGDPATSLRVLWGVRRRGYAPMAFEQRVEAYSLADPAGPLPLERLEELSLPVDLLHAFATIWMFWGHATSARLAREIEPDDRHAWYDYELSTNGVTTTLRIDLAAIFAELLARTGSDAAARRQVARLLLKHCRVPDRVVPDGEGGWTLEAFDDGRWHALDLAPAAGVGSLSAGTSPRQPGPPRVAPEGASAGPGCGC